MYLTITVLNCRAQFKDIVNFLICIGEKYRRKIKMKIKCLFGSVLALIILVNVCYSANILYLSTTPSPSHHIWDKTLAMALIKRNHNITFFTHSPEQTVENYTPIVIEGIDNMLANFDYTTWLDFGIMDSIMGFYKYVSMSCAFDLKSKGIHTLLAQVNNGVKYDLIMMDLTSGQCMYPLIKLFGSPPVIGTSPYGLVSYFTFAFGTELSIAYSPINLQPYTDHMSFWERVDNLVSTILLLGYRHFVFMPGQQALAEGFFGKNIGSLRDIEKSFSLLLANYDPILDYPQPVPPAIIQVGGLQTKRAKALPKDLLQYLDESKHGVIYFSFGTNVRSDGMDPGTIRALLDGFAQLKENILWKFESDLPNLPSNVLIKKWLPQNDILAHPNVKLFITHGGGLSTQESMYHGVPVVGVPFFVDQHVNMRKMVARKLGLQLDYKNITSENVRATINAVLSNDVYKKNIQTISKQYKDKPRDALDTATFWVEYVLRHGGAKHLQVVARDMPFYQLWLLDIWCLVALTILVLIYTVKKIQKFRKRHQKIKKL